MKNKKYFTICPYCLNKSEIDIDESNLKSFSYNCPSCKTKYIIKIEQNIVIHSVADNKVAKIIKAYQLEANKCNAKKHGLKIFLKQRLDKPFVENKEK